LPSDYFSALLTERELAKKDSSIHTSIKPYVHFFSSKYQQCVDSHQVLPYVHEDEGKDFIFYNHLINIAPKNELINIRIDPILNVELGRDFADTIKRNLYTNTRGAIMSGTIGKQVYFETMFAENQSLFPNYLYQGVNNLKVVPGQGRFKTFKETAFDYAFSSGFVSIQAAKNFNIQVGHGKQKIGNGYRSLLLSDNSFNYPFIRFTEQWFKGKIQYSSIYAVLMNFAPAAKKQTFGIEPLLQKKAASFQYLSINPTNFLNLSFFQGLIWQAGDDRNRQHLSWQYFNPIIYTQLASYGLNNKNNILIGADMKLKLSNTLNMFYQFMADDLGTQDTLGKGYGHQAGFNYFDAFGIKRLFLQGEFNFVSEGSYNNVENEKTNQAYSHYNQNLAFTLGHGRELIVMANYKIKRFDLILKYNYQEVLSNKKVNYFNNIINLRLGYTINTAYNLNASLGYTYRSQNFANFNNLNIETGYFFIALKTSLYNFYYDF
jgi:hypothetical protein